MLTRRKFVPTVGMGAGAAAGAWIAARGRENSLWSALETELSAQAQPAAAAAAPIILSSNENPTGPGQVVLDAITAAYGAGGATPGRYSNQSGALVEALAKHHGVQTQNIVLGCGSTQILRSATHLFTARTKAMVGTIPTYEECAGYAD